MVAFDELLIAGLDRRASRLCVQSKRFQRLGLKRRGLSLARRLACPLAEHAERIADTRVIARMPGTLLRKIRPEAGVAIGAHRPGRAMTGQRLLLEACDVAVGEAGE